jgi:hypothetical protein
MRQEAITRGGAPCEPINRPSGCEDPGVIRLAVGPARDYPSWNWVGADTARELAKYADVALFESFRRIPPSDAVMIVKHRPPLALARALRGRGTKLVYVPVDIYASRADIHRDRMLLEEFDLVLAHDELLLECLRPYCSRVGLVEHHGKYTLADMAPYKPDGYVLWIGGLQHSPYLMDWLARHPIGREVRLLTDVGNRIAAGQALNLARHLDIRFEVGARSINGYALHQWSEAEQRRMMQACRAAIDIKGEDFSQSTKPPTKAQKFISSGIPFACNWETSASRYFRKLGFELASPLEEEAWFSEDYWLQTRRFAEDLRSRITLESVGRDYWAFLQSL